MTRTTKEQRDALRDPKRLAETLFRNVSEDGWSSEMVEEFISEFHHVSDPILALLDEIEGAEKGEAERSKAYRSPQEDAAYFGSIWSLSTFQMGQLEQSFRDHETLYAAPVTAKVTEEMEREGPLDAGEENFWRQDEIDSAVESEREACAKLCDEEWADADSLWQAHQAGEEADDSRVFARIKGRQRAATDIAQAIRARAQAALSHKGGGNGE